MARLVGVDLPRDKRLEVAHLRLRHRPYPAFETLNATGVSGDTRGTSAQR